VEYHGCADTLKPWFESGPVTADLTTTVLHSYKLLINGVKPVHLGTYIGFVSGMSSSENRGKGYKLTSNQCH